jgi:hypothetical protein
MPKVELVEAQGKYVYVLFDCALQIFLGYIVG